MNWTKLGLIFCPNGQLPWAQHSFLTPVPLQIDSQTIRIYGGMRDSRGVSRIGWIDVDSSDPQQIKAVCDRPALSIGEPGMFDDNGMILGDVIKISETEIRMYYVGFQLVDKVKFLAFSGLAISNDGGTVFNRIQKTPILGRSSNATFLNALHSIEIKNNVFRAWISCGSGWQKINGINYPKYDCWTICSSDGVYWDVRDSKHILGCNLEEYRIGRPRVNRTSDGGYEMRVSSDTVNKKYSCFCIKSQDGIKFSSKRIIELPPGEVGSWDHEMTCYPARLDTTFGDSYLFYNGNEMGRTGVGVARKETSTID